MQKLTILVDVQNIYYTTRQAYGRNFDYNRFWQEITEGREVVRALAFACDPGDKKQQQFQNILRAIGFEVRIKPYIQRGDGSAKCDWDVGITIEAMLAGDDSDVLVLASGDGDFELLVRHLRQQSDTEVEVYGVPKLSANALISAATRFKPIEGELIL